MNKKAKNMKAVLMAIACASMVLAGFVASYGQDSSEVGEESFVKPVAYTSESLRDPFEGYIIKQTAPLSASQLAQEENFIPPPLAISGVTWGSSFPQAIVNGKVVKAGDLVGEAQVVSISKEGLVFLYRNQQFSLPAPGANSGAQSGSKTP